MNPRTIVGSAIVAVMALISNPPAWAAQSGDRQTASADPNAQAAEAAPRVIRTLPPVTFGTAKPQSAAASQALDRQYAEAVEKMRAFQAHMAPQTRVVCGLTMVEQSPEIDPKILGPSDGREGAAVRRIEPQTCANGK